MFNISHRRHFVDRFLNVFVFCSTLIHSELNILIKNSVNHIAPSHYRGQDMRGKFPRNPSCAMVVGGFSHAGHEIMVDHSREIS